MVSIRGQISIKCRTSFTSTHETIARCMVTMGSKYRVRMLSLCRGTCSAITAWELPFLCLFVSQCFCFLCEFPLFSKSVVPFELKFTCYMHKASCIKDWLLTICVWAVENFVQSLWFKFTFHYSQFLQLSGCNIEGCELHVNDYHVYLHVRIQWLYFLFSWLLDTHCNRLFSMVYTGIHRNSGKLRSSIVVIEVEPDRYRLFFICWSYRE